MDLLTWEVLVTDGAEFTVEATEETIRAVLRDTMLDRFAGVGAHLVGVDMGSPYCGRPWHSISGGEGSVASNDLTMIATFVFRPQHALVAAAA